MRGVVFVMALAVVLLHPRAGSGVDESEFRILMEKEDSMTREEYMAGMDQKKLALEKDDVAGALREVLWETCSAIAVGDGYSVVLQTRQAHPIVAEYHRRVMVFAGDNRRGGLAGALQLSMKFGGRTCILLYRHLDGNGKVTHVTFLPRDQGLDSGGQSIRLSDPDFETPPDGSRKEYVGLISGDAYPLKFITPMVLSEQEARARFR